MKIHQTLFLIGVYLLSLHCFADPLSKAFTYQGRLNDGGNPANGTYDFRFRLSSDAQGNNYVGSPVLSNGVSVANGLFTVTLDFGSVFTNSNYWLEVDVRSNNTVSYTTLAPLQPLTPTPYALFADTSSNLTGTLPVAQLSGTLANSQLANSAITVTAGNGLSGGGQVPLGGTTTLSNAGVLSITGNGDITANSNAGNVTLGSTATAANTPNAIVKRDASGSFTAGAISASSVTGDGSGLTALNASSLASGTIAEARIPANIAHLDASQNFSGVNTFNSPGNTFTGNGSGLTALSAGSLASGTVPDARLSPNVAQLNGNQVFSGSNVFNNPVGIGTATPNQQLHVIGNIMASGTSFASDFRVAPQSLRCDSY